MCVFKKKLLVFVVHLIIFYSCPGMLKCFCQLQKVSSTLNQQKMSKLQTAGTLILLFDPHGSLTLDMFTLLPAWPFSRIRLRSEQSRCSHRRRLACFIHFRWGPAKKKKKRTQHVAAEKVPSSSTLLEAHVVQQLQSPTWMQTKLNGSRRRYTGRFSENNATDLQHTSDSERADDQIFFQ